MSSLILPLCLISIGYLSGSLCSAILISRLFQLPNPCAEGSKNPGATNVLRLAGKKYAVMVLIVDVLKGTLPVALAGYWMPSPMVQSFVALAAVLGHIYPIFFGFKGGKGVATALGSYLGLQLSLGLLVLGTWLLMAKTFRYSSLASITALTLAPLFAWGFFEKVNMLPALILISVVIISKHQANIQRLLTQTEPKIGDKKA